MALYSMDSLTLDYFNFNVCALQIYSAKHSLLILLQSTHVNHDYQQNNTMFQHLFFYFQL